MKHLISVLIFCLSALSGFSQNSYLQGQVLTKYTISDKAGNVKFDTLKFPGTRLLLINLKSRDTVRTQTFTDGKFYFENIAKGSYHLFVDDPLLKNKKPIYISVISSNRNTLKPIVVDRSSNILKVKKK